MWTTVRVLFGGVVKAVIQALWVWIRSEAGQFVAEYLVRAKPIVRELAKRDDLSPAEKAKVAADMLACELKAMGVEHKESWIKQTVEIAWSTVKDEIQK